MTEASRVQKMLNEQNEWIDKLKSQVMRLELDVVGYRVRNKQLEAALAHIYAWYPISVSEPLQTIKEISIYARKALEVEDD
jgi:hypothetical protein